MLPHCYNINSGETFDFNVISHTHAVIHHRLHGRRYKLAAMAEQLLPYRYIDIRHIKLDNGAVTDSISCDMIRKK